MRGTLSIVAVTAVAMLSFAASAGAEEIPSRAEYVQQVEPICEANTTANKRILKNARTKARSNNRDVQRQAGAQFIHASAVFGKTVEKLSTVPRPPADDTRLLRWFGQLDVVKTNLRKLGLALRAGEEIKAAHEQIRVERSSNAANNVSFAFEFNYCRLTPSRFF